VYNARQMRKDWSQYRFSSETPFFHAVFPHPQRKLTYEAGKAARQSGVLIQSQYWLNIIPRPQLSVDDRLQIMDLLW